VKIAVVVALTWMLLARRCDAAPPEPNPFLRLQRSYVNVIVESHKPDGHGGDATTYTAGSGVVLFSDGRHSLVLTCAHVVDYTKPLIIVYGEDEFDALTPPLVATVQKIDHVADLALLMVDGRAGVALPLAPQEPPRWSRVYGMGNGSGAGAWASEGILSSRVFLLHQQRYWRVTAPMIFGMSGGPIMDSEGRLVCIMSNVMSHHISTPDGKVTVNAPIASFAYCIPLGGIRKFLEGSAYAR
jgi:S1-C subfamily serine protease